ncbi:MAG: ribonuclease P protein component [Thermotogota bacterium]|nr:ribonuclease P protein component [Thermotogota bacterium]
MIPATLKKTELIRKKADFKRVLNSGTAIEDRFFIIFIFYNGLPFSRIGISIRKKFGSAVKRNRLKRLVKEVYRTRKMLFPSGYDILFIARRELSDSFKCNNMGYTDIEEKILNITINMMKRVNGYESYNTESNYFL